MAVAVEDWQSELQQLRDQSTPLSAALEQAATELQTHGWEPSEMLLSDLQRFRAAFRRLREAVLDGRPERIAAVRSLQDLSGEIAVQERNATARRVAEETRRLTSRDPQAAAALARIDQERAALTEQLQPAQPLPDLVEEVLAHRHPLQVAIHLVTAGDQLSDGDWETRLDQVRTALGREVAVAIARGRMIVTSA